MSIKAVSEKFGIAAETLRYYERVGVIPPVPRTSGDARDYGEEDVAWVANGGRADRVFAALSHGDETICARRDLLCREREALLAQQRQLQQTLKKLNYKISGYDEAVKTGKLVWDRTEEGGDK